MNVTEEELTMRVAEALFIKWLKPGEITTDQTDAEMAEIAFQAASAFAYRAFRDQDLRSTERPVE